MMVGKSTKAIVQLPIAILMEQFQWFVRHY